MKKQNLGATLVMTLSASVVVAASCSFPSYNITLASSTGAGGGSASSSSAGGGGAGGGSSSVASTSTSTSTAASSSAMSSSGAGGAGGGPCTVDVDGDGFASWECGGPDCADQDDRAHPGADYLPGPAIKGARSPVTLPFDFDCDTNEMKETKTLNCTGVCLDSTTKGFKEDVDCGVGGTLGHCESVVLVGCTWVSNSTNKIERCK